MATFTVTRPGRLQPLRRRPTPAAAPRLARAPARRPSPARPGWARGLGDRSATACGARLLPTGPRCRLTALVSARRLARGSRDNTRTTDMSALRSAVPPAPAPRRACAPRRDPGGGAWGHRACAPRRNPGGRVGAPRLRKGDGVGAAPAQRGPGDRGARASHIWRSPPGGRSGVGQRAGPGPGAGPPSGAGQDPSCGSPAAEGGADGPAGVGAAPGPGVRAQLCGLPLRATRCLFFVLM